MIEFFERYGEEILCIYLGILSGFVVTGFLFGVFGVEKAMALCAFVSLGMLAFMIIATGLMALSLLIMDNKRGKKRW